MALEFQNFTFIGDSFGKGGINLNSAVTDLKDNESPSCRNVHFSIDGAITKRNGFSRKNFNNQITEGGVGQTITGIYQLNQSTGNSCTIIGAGTMLYEDAINPASFQTGQTPGALYDFTTLNDYAIIVDGVDDNLKYDCITASGLGIDAPTIPVGLVSLVPGSIPPGTYQYVYTYVNGNGRQSNPSPAFTVVIPAGPDKDVNLNSITTSSDPQVVSRKLYRTSESGGIFLFVADIPYPATIYTDSTLDQNLGQEVEFDNDKPPVLKYVETHKNRLFGIEAANPNTLVFSKLLNESSWPALFFIDIDLDDGDVITGIKSFFDQLVIFKRETIYVLTGNDETDFNVQRVHSDSRIGAISNRTICVIDNQVAFLSEQGPYAFDGLRTTAIGKNILPVFKRPPPGDITSFNWSQEAITCAVNYKNGNKLWYWLQIPTGASLQNNLTLIYDYQDGMWTIFNGLNIHTLAIVEEQNNPCLYGGDYYGFITKQDDTDSDGYVHRASYSTSAINGPFLLIDDTQVATNSTATAGGANTLTDATLGLGDFPNTVNGATLQQIYISAGTGAGQVRTVASNTISPVVFTVSVPWTTVPDATSVYQVGGFPVNKLEGLGVKIIAGKGVGQIRTITTNDAFSFNISQAWGEIPDTTSKYSIGYIDAYWATKWFHYNNPEFFKRLRYVQVNRHLDGSAIYSVQMCLYFDFDSGPLNAVCRDIVQTANGALWDIAFWDVDYFESISDVITRFSNDGGKIHRYVQAVFKNDAGAQPFTINSLNYLYQIKGVRH